MLTSPTAYYNYPSTTDLQFSYYTSPSIVTYNFPSVTSTSPVVVQANLFQLMYVGLFGFAATEGIRSARGDLTFRSCVVSR